MERKRKETKREPERVRHDIGIPELETRREYEILKLGIIIATDAGMKAFKATADTTLKFINGIMKEMEDGNK
jgi:hypothetical protein